MGAAQRLANGVAPHSRLESFRDYAYGELHASLLWFDCVC
jgi:hypothetical protein